MLTMDHAVLPATHTFIDKWNEPYLPLLPMQPQSVTALWPVLIFHPDEGRRLSWFEWLVTNQGGLPTHRWSPIAVLIDPDRRATTKPSSHVNSEYE